MSVFLKLARLRQAALGKAGQTASVPSPDKAAINAENRARRAAEFESLKAALREAASPTSPYAHLAASKSTDYETAVATTAQRIIDAGATARAGGPHAEPSGQAKKILDAAALARSGGSAAAEPTDPTARAILKAAAKRDAEGPALFIGGNPRKMEQSK